jgi:hypothetical protein
LVLEPTRGSFSIISLLTFDITFISMMTLRSIGCGRHRRWCKVDLTLMQSWLDVDAMSKYRRSDQRSDRRSSHLLTSTNVSVSFRFRQKLWLWKEAGTRQDQHLIDTDKLNVSLIYKWIILYFISLNFYCFFWKLVCWIWKNTVRLKLAITFFLD